MLFEYFENLKILLIAIELFLLVFPLLQRSFFIIASLFSISSNEKIKRFIDSVHW